MTNEVIPVKCTLVRGGTSKAVFIMANELPRNPFQRDKTILAIFGSPDPRQLDGLGGADITTSKLAIIGPSTHPEADVDYTFGQVSLDKAFIDYGGNCGNISSGVGPFAINNNMVVPAEPVTTVRIHLTNSGSILLARVRVRGGRALVDGDCSIGGVPGTGSPIEMDWTRVQGSSTGRLIPTGQPVDSIEMDGRKYQVSIIDAGNIVIYVRAEDFGLTGRETPDQINGDRNLTGRIEKFRGLVCQKIGLVETWADAALKTPYQPFVCFVAPPAAYQTYTGLSLAASDMDLLVRIYLMGAVVKAFPGTATACTGFAARIPGSVVEQTLSTEARAKERLSLGHPTGVIEFTSIGECPPGADLPSMREVSFIRTARVLMEGIVYVRRSVLE